MTKRSDILYQKHRDAGEKFDYFVCASSGAIFAYIAKGYTPRPLTFGPSDIEIVSIVLLGASFFCGLKRIETYIDALKFNYDHVESSEKHTDILKAIDDGKFPVLSSTGEVLDLAALAARGQIMEKKKTQALSSTLHEARKSFSFYRKAQMFLVLGILAIVLHRLLVPYT